jgi:hypothetical protein
MTYKVKYPTMAELKAMSAQDIFDHVAEHLMKQGDRAWDAGREMCRYRDNQGRACAVGCLIPTAAYKLSFEGADVDQLLYGRIGPRSGLHVLRKHEDLLRALQRVHDDGEVADWPPRLREVANLFGLKAPKVIL